MTKSSNWMFDSKVDYGAGFALAMGVYQALGVKVTMTDLKKALKEIADGDVTIAVTTTDLLGHLETLQGGPLTDEQKDHYKRVVISHSEQDKQCRAGAKLMLEALSADMADFKPIK